MDYKEKLKKRLYIAIIYTALGVMMIVGANITQTDNHFISSFGLGLVICGIIRIRNYIIITKNEETIQKQRIAENDERNIAIMHRARSITFFVYTMISCAAVIVLSLFNQQEAAQLIGGSLCLLLIIYWISYWVIRKKS